MYIIDIRWEGTCQVGKGLCNSKAAKETEPPRTMCPTLLLSREVATVIRALRNLHSQPARLASESGLLCRSPLYKAPLFLLQSECVFVSIPLIRDEEPGHLSQTLATSNNMAVLGEDTDVEYRRDKLFIYRVTVPPARSANRLDQVSKGQEARARKKIKQ